MRKLILPIFIIMSMLAASSVSARVRVRVDAGFNLQVQGQWQTGYGRGHRHRGQPYRGWGYPQQRQGVFLPVAIQQPACQPVSQPVWQQPVIVQPVVRSHVHQCYWWTGVRYVPWYRRDCNSTSCRSHGGRYGDEHYYEDPYGRVQRVRVHR